MCVSCGWRLKRRLTAINQASGKGVIAAVLATLAGIIVLIGGAGVALFWPLIIFQLKLAHSDANRPAKVDHSRRNSGGFLGVGAYGRHTAQTRAGPPSHL